MVRRSARVQKDACDEENDADNQDRCPLPLLLHSLHDRSRDRGWQTDAQALHEVSDPRIFLPLLLV